MQINRTYAIQTKIIICICLVFISCTNFKAYFNTFYNAEIYFEKAEKSRLQNRGQVLPKVAVDNYKKVIEKSKIVIDEFPESKLRKDALLLTVKSQFHLQEYNNAQGALSLMNTEFGSAVQFEAAFWSSMIKWKEGKVQPAINDLSKLIKEDNASNKKAKIFLAIAEIYFDQKMISLSMDNLVKAAEYIRDPNEKGQIYYRIADISFKENNLDRALEAYKLVIKNSETKKQVQEGHLKSVQIYRLQQKLELATKSIKNMLLDVGYSAIHSDLELELAKLYAQQSMIVEAINRLESIVQDYKNTIASSEAYYLLGQFAISNDWNLDAALKYFQMVPKENNKSLFIDAANIRLKEINAYKDAQLKFSEWMQRLEETDSLKANPLTKDDKISLNKTLYGMAELEAFHFNRASSGMQYLDKIIELSLDTSILPKALYAKSFILEKEGKDSLAFELKNMIINNYSKTDYALAIMNADSTFSALDLNSDKNLVVAENKWLNDPILALDKYKQIIKIDTLSESSAKAAYFLAYQYDYKFVKADSALKYYKWIMKYHQDSEQSLFSQKRIVFLNNVLSDSAVINVN
ncbi:MAG: tetratricopeptide repeat protein [Fidelibacterota bacterium]